MDEVEEKTLTNPVIDAKFCISRPIHLILKPKKKFLHSTIFNVLDPHGNQLFRILKTDGEHSERSILDGTNSPVAILRRKAFSSTWRVYRGKNTEEAMVSVKRQDALTLNVFMGSTVGEKGRGDLDVVGYPPTIYKGDMIVADVNNNFSWGGDDLVKKDGFKLRVSAGTDYIFIVSLIMIHKDLALSNSSSSSTPAVLGGGVASGAAIASASAAAAAASASAAAAAAASASASGGC